jgi:cobalt-zinc-cadmium resistance protein CzcA
VVADTLATAVGGKALTEVVEGERSFDLALRWPERLRFDRQSILDMPVDVGTNVVESSPDPTLGPTLLTGAAVGPAPIGSAVTRPSLTGSTRDAAFNNLSRTPRRRLGGLVTPLNADGELDPAHGSFVQPGASTIYREEGHRLIAIKFGVHGRDLAGRARAASRFGADDAERAVRTLVGRRFGSAAVA